MEFIYPLRSQSFSFQLKKSNKPRSKLTDAARKYLYEDYLFLQTEEQKRQVTELKVGTNIYRRGIGSFDGKRLAAHYCIKLKAMYAIINQGNRTADTTAKKRAGRKKVLTTPMVNLIGYIIFTF